MGIVIFNWPFTGFKCWSLFVCVFIYLFMYLCSCFLCNNEECQCAKKAIVTYNKIVQVNSSPICTAGLRCNKGKALRTSDPCANLSASSAEGERQRQRAQWQAEEPRAKESMRPQGEAFRRLDTAWAAPPSPCLNGSAAERSRGRTHHYQPYSHWERDRHAERDRQTDRQSNLEKKETSMREGNYWERRIEMRKRDWEGENSMKGNCGVRNGWGRGKREREMEGEIWRD